MSAASNSLLLEFRRARDRENASLSSRENLSGEERDRFVAGRLDFIEEEIRVLRRILEEKGVANDDSQGRVSQSD